jgi:hypothetical protein
VPVADNDDADNVFQLPSPAKYVVALNVPVATILETVNGACNIFQLVVAEMYVNSK